MIWRIVFSVCLLVLILALPPPVESADETLVDRLLVHLNQMRVESQLQSLTWNAELTWAVGAGVEDMARRGYFAHTSPEGITAVQRAERAGYGSFVGEVLVRGASDPSEIVRLWMESDGHRANLLMQEYRDIGLWTAADVTGVMFGARETEPAGTRIAHVALRYQGVPYVWGGFSPAGFDCAGFVWFVYREAGVYLDSHYIPSLAQMGERIPWGEWRPGDLLIFEGTYKVGLSHVGIYLRDWQFVHAVAPQVRVSDIREQYWQDHYASASRAWE